VLGAAGGIGQPLSMLLKLNPDVTHLSCYDVAPFTPGVAADLSHCCTGSTCSGHTADELAEALEGAEIVVIPAGVPRKPGMTRDDLFNTNASIVKTLIEGVAKHCPTACINIISNPVNSTVPIAAEVLKAAGVYNPKKLFGVTTLDVVRAKTFVGEMHGKDPAEVEVPVVGGHAGTTIVPLLSQSGFEFTDEQRDALTQRIMFGGDEVVKAKAGAGSATLSMAFAGAEFTAAMLRAMNGSEEKMCSFVESDVTSNSFFSTYVTLGKDGLTAIHPIGPVTEYEQGLIDAAVPDLAGQADKGVAFATA